MLVTAPQKSNTKVAELLLDSGADPRSPSNGGWTPLHCAGTVFYLLVNQKYAAKKVELKAN